VSRFEGGLLTGLQPPDRETRLAILHKKAHCMAVALPEHILEFLADRIRTNIRRLEGALTRTAMYAALTQQKLSPQVVEGLLQDVLAEEGRSVVNIELIKRRVAEHFHIALTDMTSRRLQARVAFPRQIAMYLSRRMTASSLTDVGEAFGDRYHGTVLHACRLVKDRMDVDPEIQKLISHLEWQLQRCAPHDA
jgi:chromosomal replication initiator protein